LSGEDQDFHRAVLVELIDDLVAFSGTERSEKLQILDAETVKDLRADEFQAGAHLAEN